MFKKIIIILLSLVCIYILTGCAINNIFFNQSDVVELQSFFVKNNGDLYYRGRRHCIINNFKNFILYDFGKYSIAVTPKNWSDSEYEFFIFIGHVKNINDLRKNKLFILDKDSRALGLGKNNDSIKYFKTNKIGFKNFYLGTHINKKDLAKIEQSEDNISTTQELKGHNKYLFAYGKTDNIFFQLEYRNGYLIWMHFLCMK
ncbi:MAG: hypothetical protein GY756_19050 [bacterium]|nr:hypothetical protein [bacterium]